MHSSNGMLNLDQLRQFVESGEIETVAVVFTDLYGRFLGKRFEAQHFLSNVAEQGTHACDYLLTVDMEMEPTPGFRYSNWDKGYGDFHLKPDFQTLRIADWLERTALVVCDVLGPVGHEFVSIAPRSLLRRQVASAVETGLRPMAGSELEYYLFRTSYRDAAEQGHAERSLDPASWYIEDYHILQATREEDFQGQIRRHLLRSGVPVESTKGEWGKGQHELNIHYADALVMADNHAVFKQCVKEKADAMGVSVTFMAKYSEQHAGSSCHIHLSMREGDENVFAGDSDLDGVACSDHFRWFLAGWLDRAPEVMAFYAPTVNSYKRYQAGSWAPTRLAWSRDNRTAGFRVVGAGPSLRIECRLPGADCNPYLAFAAALASGLDGVARQLEPPAAFDGNIYEAEELDLAPPNLKAAVDLFERSEFAKQAFGEDVVEHYVHFFRVEQAAFDKAVTDWERRRYFERI